METQIEIEAFIKGLTYFTIIFFVLQWIVMTWFIGKQTGWTQLAKAYPQRDRFRDKYNQFGCLKMKGFGGYNNCVCYGADQQGIYLALWPIFRIGHPPVFLPWHEITFKESEFRGKPGSKLIPSQTPEIPLIMPAVMVTKMATQSGREITHV